MIGIENTKTSHRKRSKVATHNASHSFRGNTPFHQEESNKTWSDRFIEHQKGGATTTIYDSCSHGREVLNALLLGLDKEATRHSHQSNHGTLTELTILNPSRSPKCSLFLFYDESDSIIR